MRRVALFLSFAFVLALAGCPPAFAQDSPGTVPGLEPRNGPVAEVAEKTHDFGDMTDGGIYKYSFVLKNNGNAPLEIKKIMPA